MSEGTTVVKDDQEPTEQLSALDRYFGFAEHGTTIRVEAVAGLTTFLAMAYILFVNPSILGATGMDTGAVFVATGIAAAIGTLIMGLWAKYPIAQAPGMGLNAFFAFTVVLGMGIDWEVALAGTLVSGFLFLLLTVSGLRTIVINAIPMQMKLAIGAGIGLFIAFIGLRNAGIIVGYEPTFVTLGDITAGPVLLAIFGIVVTAALLIRGLGAAVFYGIIVTALAGVVFGLIDPPTAVVSTPPSLAPTFGVAFTHLPELFTAQMMIVVFTMLFVDFFDTAGTIIAVSGQAGLLDAEGNLPRAGRALSADAIATMAGAAVGTSTTTSYIESTAGVAAGGRTGFSSVVTGGLFIVALIFSPLLAVITEEVTAPALVIVGVLMVRALGQIEWEKMEYAIPAFVTMIAMPLTFSIANGIALGLFLFPMMLVFKGRWREVHPVMYGLFFIFLAYFIWFLE
jgi:adenine/guanine/hypoxanthine permease